MKVACFLEIYKNERRKGRNGRETREHKIVLLMFCWPLARDLCCILLCSLSALALVPHDPALINQPIGGPQQKLKEPKKKKAGVFFPFCSLSVSSVWV